MKKFFFFYDLTLINNVIRRARGKSFQKKVPEKTGVGQHLERPNI